MNPNSISGSGGLYLNGKLISNAVPVVTGLYNIQGEVEPSIVEFSIWVGTLPPKNLYVPTAELNFATLHKKFPPMICSGSKEKRIFDAYLNCLYVHALEDFYNGTPRVKIGIFANQNGFFNFPMAP